MLERNSFKKQTELESLVTTIHKPPVMEAIESLGCNWWKNMHEIDA